MGNKTRTVAWFVLSKRECICLPNEISEMRMRNSRYRESEREGAKEDKEFMNTLPLPQLETHSTKCHS
jgi:hypothetical protein